MPARWFTVSEENFVHVLESQMQLHFDLSIRRHSQDTIKNK